MKDEFFNKDYYESGPQSGKSLYQNYRWIPELTIPLAHHIVQYLNIKPEDTVMDFGCAKGYLVHALRLLGIEARGVDISKYAIDNAPKEVSNYVKHILPYADFKPSKYVLCKDILEHIPYDCIDKQLSILRACSLYTFAIVPLGEEGKYIIPAYELDKSHFIREPVDWWVNKFIKAGFNIEEATTNLGPFKANWQNVDSRGNLLIIGK